MAGKSGAGGRLSFELSALEREGMLWHFTLSSPQGGILLNYESEEHARRAQMLIFEALKDVVQPGADTGIRAPKRRIPAFLKKAISRLRRQRG